MKAPYIRYKDYDHEDVETDFTVDHTLAIISNVLASIGVFALLMCALAVMMQVPESWMTWLLLYAFGL